MCFVTDFDWYASVQEESSLPAVKPTLCDECGYLIPIGEVVHHTHQQQHESCSDCYNGHCSCPRDSDGDCINGCQCDPPNFGETYDNNCCDDCRKFLLAVQAAEREAGCDELESCPPMGWMRDSINDGGMEEAKKYWIKAKSLYPELAASGYLGRLWRETF